MDKSGKVNTNDIANSNDGDEISNIPSDKTSETTDLALDPGSNKGDDVLKTPDPNPFKPGDDKVYFFVNP